MKSATILPSLIVLLVVFALTIPPGMAEEEATLEFDLRTVATLTAAGRYRDALSLARDLLAKHPDSLEVHIVYQDLRLASGEKKELTKEYSSRAGKAGATPDARYLHARLLTGSKQLNLLKKVLRIDPKHFQALCAIGINYTEAGKYRDAENNLLAATQVRRSSAVPWNCIGALEERRGDLEMAEQNFRKAVEADPEHAASRLNLGSLLIISEKLDEAEVELAKARQLAPNSPMPILAQGMLLLTRERVAERVGEPEEGVGEEEEGKDGEGNGGADGAGPPAPKPKELPDELAPEEPGKDGADAAGADGADGEEEEEETALSLFEEAVELRSNTFTSLNMLGLALTDLREYGLAKRAFSRAIALRKEDPLSYINLCHMSLMMGQADIAATWVRQAMRYDNKSAQAYYFVGLCESALGKNRSAESAFLRATKLDGENVLFWRSLGTHYATLGKWKEAVAVFSKAIDLVGEDIDLQVDLAFAYTGAGSYARAADMFEQVVAADPTQISAWMNLGLLYKEKLRSAQKAIDCFRSYQENGGKDKRVDTWLADLER